ncbi:MAG: GNAT family N-acetyltransferase [Candidatus Paraimprobicoccus trichonymphae]|uniref:GNAT family N-acetyltransferase n=1 Tax=Candidatus Paraimprobicoccus trichonymphae TaxID=3033793 RepID=A0AA48HX95_9FIRM|nr:MAG: GNAT family N-acetyltransferase [Candidatus Paraimprobicoccus trichonymphae]
MLIHIGTQKIETERLILRKFKFLDADVMFKNWASDPENCKYLFWKEHKDIDETKKILSNWISNYERKDYYRWAICLKRTKELIGGIDIILIFEHIDCVEFGYVLSKKYWNRGIMTEAFKAAQNFMFKKVNCHRIQAKHDVRNLASGKVMKKTGMEFEGILRKLCKSNIGEWVDVSLYSILTII